jgi:hypothetical protein
MKGSVSSAIASDGQSQANHNRKYKGKGNNSTGNDDCQASSSGIGRFVAGSPRPQDEDASITIAAETTSGASVRSEGRIKTAHANDPSKITPAETKAKQINKARTHMTIIHFMMKVPKYSIGLFLFLASHTSPLPTSRTAVREPIRRLQTLVELEAKSYRDCVERFTRRSRRKLQEIATRDRATQVQLHAVNDKINLQAKEVAGTCGARTQKARDSLVRWTEDGMDIPWVDIVNKSITSDGSTCTAEKRNRTESLLGQDYALAEDQVTDALNSYIHDSRHSLTLLHSYALERSAYDWNYFVGERIQPILDYLANQTLEVDGMNVAFSVDLSVVERKIRASLELLKRTIEETKRQIDILQAKLQELIASIKAFYKAYNIAFDRLVLGADFVVDLLPPGVKLPTFFDLSTLPTADFYLPTTSLSLPQFVLAYDKIHLMLDDAALECLRTLMDVLDESRRSAGEQLRGAVREVAEFILDLLRLEDYHPPRFQGSSQGIISMEDEMDFQSRRGQETLNSTMEKLASLRVRVNQFEFGGDIQGPNITMGSHSFVQDTTRFEYLGVMFPDLSIPDVAAKILGWLAVNTWLIEILIHTYRLRRLETVHAKGAIPNLPEIVYGSEKDDDSSQTRTAYLILMFVLKNLGSPRIALFLIYLILALFAIVFWFPHVHQSCVRSSDGTILANHFLAPLMINRGNALGNTQFLLAEYDCQKSQQNWCTSLQGEADTRYRSDWTILHSFQLEQNHSLESLGLMDTCIDLTVLSTMMKESCCGLKGYGTGNACPDSTNWTCPVDSSTIPPSAYRPMESYLNDPACQELLYEWTLHDSRYDCLNLVEGCGRIPCNGVNKDLIRSYTISTDCNVELYAIDCCYFLMAIFLHAITINLIFTLLFEGFRDSRWRELNPDGIRLRTNLRENGDLVEGFGIEERTKRIAQKVGWMDLKSKIELRMGVMLVVVYFISTLVLSLRN